MRKYLFFSWILAVVLLLSCSDDKNDGVGNNVNGNAAQNASVVVLDNISQYIVDEVESDSLITFSENTPDNLLPKVGATVFIPISDKTPAGFMGKIISVEKGNPIKVLTEAAPLEEVFQNLSIDTTFVDAISNVESIVDADGNPIEYELVDTVLTDSEDTSSNSRMTRAGGYWKGGVIKFPFNIGKREDGHKLNGLLYIDVKNFDFNIDVVNNEISYISFRADPTIKVSLKDEVEIKTDKEKFEKSTLIGSINCAPITIPTPIAVPIILRPKLYLYLVYGAKGKIKASMGLQYQTSFESEIHWKNRQWDKRFFSKGPKNEKPWTVAEFDVSGEVYAGSKMGLLVGFYSATTGVGVNITPKFSLAADAKLSTDNLLDINPEVELAAKWSGDLYFTASLFKRPIAHYSFSTPEYVVWSEKMYLLPQFKNFEARGSSSSGEVDYQIDSHYFLSLLGVKTGTRIYDSDKKTVIGTYYPNPTKTDNKGNKYYNASVDGLSPGKTYYAAPIASLFNFAWPSGKKYEFTTEASYRFDFRCQGQSYDIISFNFNLNDANSNSFLVTSEGQDYNNGPFFNAIIKGSLNKGSNTLEGTVEMNFIGLPEQRRIDAFSIPLGSNGYVNTTKVLDNGACYTAIRITNESNAKARAISYDGVILESDSDCNVGLSIH